jgi:hypothetical protein
MGPLLKGTIGVGVKLGAHVRKLVLPVCCGGRIFDLRVQGRDGWLVCSGQHVGVSQTEYNRSWQGNQCLMLEILCQ